MLKKWGKDLKFSGWNRGLSRDCAFYYVLQSWTCRVKLIHVEQHHPSTLYKPQFFNTLLTMAPHTTAAEKAIICTLKKQGISHNDIHAALTNHHDITDQQIIRIFQWYTDKENYDEVGHSTGCPHKLTPRDTRVALWHLANCDAANATELRNSYFPEASVETVKGVLRGEGRHAHIQATVPFISKKNLGIRKEWAAAHLHWTVANWRAVNFSDESIFHIFGSDGIQWCWRIPGERLDPWYTRKALKHGGGKVTIWGMIMSHGVGRFVRIEGNLNKELYHDILQEHTVNTTWICAHSTFSRTMTQSTHPRS